MLSSLGQRPQRANSSPASKPPSQGQSGPVFTRQALEFPACYPGITASPLLHCRFYVPHGAHMHCSLWVLDGRDCAGLWQAPKCSNLRGTEAAESTVERESAGTSSPIATLKDRV